MGGLKYEHEETNWNLCSCAGSGWSARGNGIWDRKHGQQSAGESYHIGFAGGLKSRDNAGYGDGRGGTDRGDSDAGQLG